MWSATAPKSVEPWYIEGIDMKDSEQFRVGLLRFIGEQDGPPERELKSRLAQLFSCEQSIWRAYLARVAYADLASNAVALCLRAPSDADPNVVDKVGKVFASMFVHREHLDIVFINDVQESELTKCCRPFFNAGDYAGLR
jgi:hypothetical protein